MIEKLRSLAIFATVVDQGSFRAAARELGLAPSRISQTVSDLEKELGITLLYRSTRQQSLTQEGEVLYRKVRDMLNAAESGLDAISPMSDEPVGNLRVTVPAFLVATGLMDTLAQYAKQHPKVSLNLHFSDRPQDLIKDGYDVAIRAGWLQDSDLLARNVGSSDRLLVASPDYYDSKPVPTEPSDLDPWNWVRFLMRPKQTEMTSPKGETVTVVGQSHVSVDSAVALNEFALRGLGLTELPEHLARRGIESGDLIHVLPEWTLRPLGVHAVWPDRSRRESLTLSFVRFLAEAPD
jgi:DNA-binding transcriptional LysR family regulator